jgi:hypothetical protein
LTSPSGLFGGVVFGFTLAWARLTDPRVIRDMLLLKEAHVFLIMGSAVAIAAIGVRALKASGARCLGTGEPVGWRIERPGTRHVAGSMLFALGWTVAGAGGRDDRRRPTCRHPGRHRLLAGVTLQRMLAPRKDIEGHMPAAAVVGL